MSLRLATASCVLLLLGSCGSRSTLAGAGDGGPQLFEGGVTTTEAGASCSTRTTVQPLVTFDCGQEYYPGGALQVDEGWVLYASVQTLGSNSPTDLDLFARHAATGQLKQLTADDLQTQLVGAADGELLFGTFAKYFASGQLYYRTKTKTVALGPVEPTELYGHEYAARPPRLISQGQVVWRAGQTLYRYDGVATHAIAPVKVGYSIALDHDAGRVVWTAYDDKDHEVYLYRDGAVAQLTQNETEDLFPQLSGDSVLWICDGAICRWQAGTVQVLDKGKCTDLAVGQAGALAWVCDGQVMLRDGKGTRAIAGERGDKLTREGLRLAGGRLLWLEAAQPFDYHASGRIVLFDGERLHELDRVVLPCLYCNAYWPPLELALSGDVAAWSYHLGDREPKPGAGSCAYTTLTTQRECTP